MKGLGKAALENKSALDADAQRGAAPVFGAEMNADAINSAEPSRKTCRQFLSSDARTEDDWKTTGR
jgi:hypothetical protein